MRLSRADVLTGAAGFGASLALGALVYIAISVHSVIAHVPGTAPRPSPSVSSTSGQPAATRPASPGVTPSSSPPPASLSPVVALRYPGTVTTAGGPGAASAGTTGGSGGSGSGGSGRGPQPTHAPSPAPSPSSPQPKPSPTPRVPPPGCVRATGLAICASVRIAITGG